MNVTNKNTILETVQAVNDRDFDLVRKNVADNFSRHDLTNVMPHKHTGSAEAVDFLNELFKGFPDMKFHIQDTIAEDDKVTIRYNIIGTHQGNFLGRKPLAKKVNFSGINIYRFENSKIAEVWQLWDWAGLMQQLDINPLK